ncbi:MAG: methylmalonyl Co-A mutase-associated GTPase MeaB, partial [Anaerolineae bacterium]|nr:methylmalonyl Co-A mutase-associated GTPase MeaB [Anaerolineae bacterium]
MDPIDIAARVLKGDRRSLARVITLIEEGGELAQAILRRLYAYTGRAEVVGVTGVPGSGKSTLVNAMARVYRSYGYT